MPRYTDEEKSQSLAKLREWLPPGATVQTILRHCSRSGMSRSISLVAQVGGELIDLDYHAARAMGDSIDNRHGGLRVSGCGMDMGFHLVYNLSATLYPEGFGCIGDGGDPGAGAIRGRGCPSNDHSNGDRDYTPHTPELEGGRPSGPGRRVHWHREGGYALRHRWL